MEVTVCFTIPCHYGVSHWECCLSHVNNAGGNCRAGGDIHTQLTYRSQGLSTPATIPDPLIHYTAKPRSADTPQLTHRWLQTHEEINRIRTPPHYTNPLENKGIILNCFLLGWLVLWEYKLILYSKQTDVTAVIIICYLICGIRTDGGWHSQFCSYSDVFQITTEKWVHWGRVQAVRTGWNDVHVCAGKLVTPFHMTGQDFNSCVIHPLIVKSEDILGINELHVVWYSYQSLTVTLETFGKGETFHL